MKTMIVRYCGEERRVEVDDGPRQWFANSEKEYYSGLVLPKPLDPYGEPYRISFTSDDIVGFYCSRAD